MDSHDLISSKENIQPLRHGRDTSILCTVLQAETHSDVQQELERQRNEFEIKLRSSVSDDPLSDWNDYIHWIEQSFPKQGKGGKLNVVLRKCITKFKDCERYLNDSRFVKLCIKYADLEENSVELLTQFHRHGIGVSCAELYIAWAEKYAVDNCFKKAYSIYEKGLNSSAQPIALLQEAQHNFQAFLARKMVNENETFQPTIFDSSPPQVRQPYNVLQYVSTGQKEIIPSLRIGSNVVGAAGKLQRIGKNEHKPKSNPIVTVYEDTENNFASAEPKAKLEKIPNKKTLSKENTIKPGTWNNKHIRNIPFSIGTVPTLGFEVHKDEEYQNVKRNRTVPSSVLKPRKVEPYYEDDNFANAPLFYSEPYDPTKVPMYCKELVYAGGLEFQFEELRAIQYRRKREEELIIKRNISNNSNIEQIEEASSKKDMLPPNSKCELLIKPKSTTKKTKSCEVKESKRTSTVDRGKELFAEPFPIITTEENIINTDYSLNQTIHTKEALSEMQQLWFSKPASPVCVLGKSKKPAGKSILKASKPGFSLYVDESCLENFKPSEKEDKPLDLTSKSEVFVNNKNEEKKVELSAKPNSCTPDIENINPLTGGLKKTDFCEKIRSVNKENFLIYEDFEDKIRKSSKSENIDDEDKENDVPNDYCGPTGKSNRKVSGILTPSENVEIALLSDEEIAVEEEEEIQDQDFSSIIQCNTTAITETWNFTKGFQFPKSESTPNVCKAAPNADECNESFFVQEPKSANTRKQIEENSSFISKESVHPRKIGTNDKKIAIEEVENLAKNLSVIAETSREYRSSSSGSSGISALASRSCKQYPYTPSEARNLKYSLATSTTFHKTKVQNYTAGYEASSESSHTALKTSTIIKDNVVQSTASDFLDKLNEIERLSISGNSNFKINEKTNKPEEEIVDPFSEQIINRLLQDIDFPKSNHTTGYFSLHQTELPVLKVGSSITLGAFTFDVKKVLGEGSYARIFSLVNSAKGDAVVAKYQKPPFPWEFYITREIQSRINDKKLATMFMDVEYAYFFKNASILLTRPVEFGDLLSVINKMKQAKILSELLALHFICQILKILETLHGCKIIHGDIKPDNFLLHNQLESEILKQSSLNVDKKIGKLDPNLDFSCVLRFSDGKLQLQLIDFGRSIDMTLFPENTTFNRVVTTDGFTTIEMKLGKPWTYQIDLYGVANCGHCLLFGDYMKVAERDGIWNITKAIPRYAAKAEWKNFFLSLLNVQSCCKLPNLSTLRKSFESVLNGNTDIDYSLSKVNNLLKNR